MAHFDRLHSLKLSLGTLQKACAFTPFGSLEEVLRVSLRHLRILRLVLDIMSWLLGGLGIRLRLLAIAECTCINQFREAARYAVGRLGGNATLKALRAAGILNFLSWIF